ncbi:MAG: GNAT family N-acetyltransferase [Lachnospiraceae bacterium]|nr:GNAT family N-acetyltransferase [Lachnospiraceae bacterium]
MDIIIQKLKPELVEDFLSYFDHTAFSDHPEWAGCYCLESHLDEKAQEELKPFGIKGRREKAKELVLDGIMNGYLAYDQEKVIGWCNADDKRNYWATGSAKDDAKKEDKTEMVKVVYCFDIAPGYRGEGIATKMLQKVCEDAKAEGYQYVEGAPMKGDTGAYQYHGTIGLYEKMGFEQYQENDYFYIMRKTIVNE